MCNSVRKDMAIKVKLHYSHKAKGENRKYEVNKLPITNKLHTGLFACIRQQAKAVRY